MQRNPPRARGALMGHVACGQAGVSAHKAVAATGDSPGEVGVSSFGHRDGDGCVGSQG